PSSGQAGNTLNSTSVALSMFCAGSCTRVRTTQSPGRGAELGNRVIVLSTGEPVTATSLELRPIREIPVLPTVPVIALTPGLISPGAPRSPQHMVVRFSVPE